MYNGRRWHVGHWIRIGVLALFGVFVAAMIYFMFVVFPSTPAAAGAYPMYPWWGFGWIWIFFLFFLVFGLMRFAFWGPRWWGGYRRYGFGPYGRENEAYHILRERYARGELTKDQYDAMLRDLYQQPPQPR